MKKYNEYINESLDGVLAFEKRVLSDVKDIIMQEEGISEKNFTYINAMNMSFNEYISSIKSEQSYHDDMKSFENKRKCYAAEFIYDKYFKEKFKISL